MLKTMLESKVGKISEEQFAKATEEATTHIKLRTKHKKMTYFRDVLNITEHFIKESQEIKTGSPAKSHPTQIHYIRNEWDKATKINKNISDNKNYENKQAIGGF